VADEDLAVVAVQSQLGTAENLERVVIGEKDCICSREEDFANRLRKLFVEVGYDPGDVVTMKGLEVAETTGGGCLLGLVEATDDELFLLGKSKHSSSWLWDPSFVVK
jgi:hypothetical protein